MNAVGIGAELVAPVSTILSASLVCDVERGFDEKAQRVAANEEKKYV